MINTVTLVGRLTADPVLKKTSTGGSTLTFSLAVGDKGRAEFHPCRAWGTTADLIAQYCRKGSQIGVEGRLHSYSYDHNGGTQYKTEVTVNSITFLGSRQEAKEEQQDAGIQDEYNSVQYSNIQPSPDDLPF